jgi:hypothetical protein
MDKSMTVMRDIPKKAMCDILKQLKPNQHLSCVAHLFLTCWGLFLVFISQPAVLHLCDTLCHHDKCIGLLIDKFLIMYD